MPFVSSADSPPIQWGDLDQDSVWPVRRVTRSAVRFLWSIFQIGDLSFIACWYAICFFSSYYKAKNALAADWQLRAIRWT